MRGTLMADINTETTEETMYELYEAVAGDTWDSIAFDLYTDEMMASRLIQENKELADILIFEGGELLAVPIIEEDEETPATAPPWRQ